MKQSLQTFLIRTGTGIIFSIIFWGILLYTPPFYFYLLLFLVFLQILSELKHIRLKLNRVLGHILLLYVLLSFWTLSALNNSTQYHDLLYHLFFIVFTFDTGSYIIGITWGRHKLFPKISPHKTWEGLIGGYILTVLLWWYTLQYTKPTLSISAIVVLTTLLCAAAILGDVIESCVKRKAKIKDTGTLLPGHGGLFDRFDSTLTTAIVFFIFRDYLANLLL